MRIIKKEKKIYPYVVAGILFFMGCLMSNVSFAIDTSQTQVKTSLVCMMNNNYMGTEQIPVPVNGKTYYGCCAGCAASLQANTNNIRYARDPYSGEEVDKAEAFISLKSPATKEVLYFKSEENYKMYSESLNSQNMSKA